MVSERISASKEVTPPEWARALEPDIFSAASSLGYAGEEYQSNYADRLAVEFSFSESERRSESGESWSFMGGDYAPEDVKLIQGRIESLLKERKKDSAPVVFFDFGGGYGESFIQLAGLFKKFVENGELVFVVSNLGYLPPSQSDEKGCTGVARSMRAVRDRDGDPVFNYTEEKFRSIEANQGLVTFLKGNALELMGQSIVVRGREVPLLGNVSLLHEKNAVTHTQVPELVFSAFGSLLRKGGELHSEISHPNNYHDRLLDVEVADGRKIDTRTDSYIQGKKQGHQVGMDLLARKYSVRKSSEGPQGGIYQKT